MKPGHYLASLCIIPAVLLFGWKAFAGQVGRPGSEPSQSRENQEQKSGIDTAKATSAGNLFDTDKWTPMTAQQKFRLGVRRTVSPVALARAAFKAGVYQSLDPDSEYGSGTPGYAKRVAVSLADGSTNRMLSTFVLPCLFSQDPRYFRRGRGTFKDRLGYSITRTFKTRTDAGGAAVNWSKILGSLGSGAISNAYYPVEDRGAALTFANAGWSILAEAGLNVFREFWPDIQKWRTNRRANSRP